MLREPFYFRGAIQISPNLSSLTWRYRLLFKEKAKWGKRMHEWILLFNTLSVSFRAKRHFKFLLKLMSIFCQCKASSTSSAIHFSASFSNPFKTKTYLRNWNTLQKILIIRCYKNWTQGPQFVHDLLLSPALWFFPFFKAFFKNQK